MIDTGKAAAGRVPGLEPAYRDASDWITIQAP